MTEAGTDARTGTETGAGTDAVPRGRPRSAAADSAITETVLRLLEEGVTIGELSIEGIARDAGVGKATVYRRWPGKNALLMDVLNSIDEPTPELAGESVRDDLVSMIDAIRRRGLAKRSSAVMRNIILQFQQVPELWKQYHDTVVVARRDAMHQVLERGVRTGEIRAGLDLELLGDIFAGPMLSRAMMRPGASLEDGLSELIVDTVLEGARPR